ncbi:hypothetical protein COB57_00090 [Candidatus Peregrinibacteria bacterium]|nr:MAG: hypothetical protein COB57_00090 [Candidatus Peregrinibacteria bacterium]
MKNTINKSSEALNNKMENVESDLNISDISNVISDTSEAVKPVINGFTVYEKMKDLENVRLRFSQAEKALIDSDEFLSLEHGRSLFAVLFGEDLEASDTEAPSGVMKPVINELTVYEKMKNLESGGSPLSHNEMKVVRSNEVLSEEYDEIEKRLAKEKNVNLSLEESAQKHYGMSFDELVKKKTSGEIA